MERVRFEHAPAGGDDLQRLQAIGGQAVVARHDAVAAAQRQSGDPDRRAAAAGDEHAARGERRVEVGETRPGADRRDAAIDADAVHRADVDDHARARRVAGVAVAAAAGDRLDLPAGAEVQRRAARRSPTRSRRRPGATPPRNAGRRRASPAHSRRRPAGPACPGASGAGPTSRPRWARAAWPRRRPRSRPRAPRCSRPETPGGFAARRHCNHRRHDVGRVQAPPRRTRRGSRARVDRRRPRRPWRRRTCADQELQANWSCQSTWNHEAGHRCGSKSGPAIRVGALRPSRADEPERVVRRVEDRPAVRRPRRGRGAAGARDLAGSATRRERPQGVRRVPRDDVLL